MLIGQHHDRYAVSVLNISQRSAFLVMQKVNDIIRCLHNNLAGEILHDLFFDQAENGQGQGLNTAYSAVAITNRAGLLAGFTQGRPQTLARHFQQSEAGNATNLDPCLINLHGIAQTFFNFTLMFAAGHIDEINHDQATEITQAQLPGNFHG